MARIVFGSGQPSRLGFGFTEMRAFRRLSPNRRSSSFVRNWPSLLNHMDNSSPSVSVLLPSLLADLDVHPFRISRPAQLLHTSAEGLSHTGAQRLLGRVDRRTQCSRGLPPTVANDVPGVGDAFPLRLHCIQ